MPGFNALGFEPILIGFDKGGFRFERSVGSVDEIVQRQIGLWAGGVEDACGFVGGAVKEERSQIAGVDETHDAGG